MQIFCLLFSFKHQLSTSKKPSVPIHFRIWQQKAASSENPHSNSKANIFYAFPAGYAYYKHLLSGDKEISSYLPKSAHLAKACFFTETDLKFNDAHDWKPSIQLLYPTEQKPISGKVSLSSILGKMLLHFTQKTAKMSGTIFLVFSGKHDVDGRAGDEHEVEMLAERFNAAGVGLRVVLVDRTPSTTVLRFFDRLNAKLTASVTSSVHYALSGGEATSSTNPIASQVFSTVNSLLWDTIQEVTENAHIPIKRETFTLPSTLNFTIDESFKGLVGYSVLVEAFTSGASSSVLFALTNGVTGEAFTASYSDTANEHLRTTLYSGNFKPGFYRLEVKSSEGGSGPSSPLVTVSIRILAETNVFRSHAKEVPILGRCWIQSTAGLDGPGSASNYPLRGYAHLSKGLNGPVYDADVSLIVRRFDVASAHQEFIVPLLDNGRASPDITARDGIYSAYLDSVLTGSTGPAAYSVFARVISDKGAALKPGNFGNTVMFKNRPRCCGSDLGVKSEDIDVVGSGSGATFERFINCGSFFSSGSGGTGAQGAPLAIRDLRLVSIDSANRTVTLQWSSPFVSSSSSKFPPEIKAFHSYTPHTQLPADIKEHWSTLLTAESEILTPPSTSTVLSSNTHYIGNGNGLSSGPTFDPTELNTIFEMAPYEQTMSMMSGSGSNTGSALMSNSLRTATLRILSAEEGYYFVAVAEHAEDGRKTRPSNVLPVYMKSNVPLENNTALAIDDEEHSQLPGRAIS